MLILYMKLKNNWKGIYQ